MASPLHRFRQENPLVQQVNLLLPDLVGVPRGKRLSVQALERAAEGEILFSSTVYSLDTTGANVDASPLVWEEGDADRPVALDLATLVPVPWRPTQAQVIGGLTEPDGSPFFADPRAVLARVADAFAERELTPVAALEFEFYLLEGEGTPRPVGSGGPDGPAANIDVYRFERLDAQAEFFDLLDRYCDAQGLETKAAVAEFAPGQFEVNLAHGTDMLRAADAGLMFKRCVKAAARACGRRACFMAKPFSDLAGSGLHVHLSLRDAQGRNLFCETPDGEQAMRRCLAGMQALMAESMAVFAPNANSYRRLQPLSYAPL
ncbi:MAG TPA: glutamine synthetase, partial [Rhodospirillales bacterium]|nr:glutamine synthetase [Rhodospirillales bacterium]